MSENNNRKYMSEYNNRKYMFEYVGLNSSTVKRDKNMYEQSGRRDFKTWKTI